MLTHVTEHAVYRISDICAKIILDLYHLDGPNIMICRFEKICGENFDQMFRYMVLVQLFVILRLHRMYIEYGRHHQFFGPHACDCILVL